MSTHDQEPCEVPLRQYVEALFDRDRAAREIADQEREKAAQALAVEREKTAQALAVSFAQMLEQSVAALREHIDQQVLQIREAFLSAERLSLARKESIDGRLHAIETAVETRIVAMAREQAVRDSAAADAINKAEALNKERWESANEWRGQSSDRERSQEEQMTKLAGTFMRQDTADAKLQACRESSDVALAELRRQVQELAEKMGKLA